MSETPSSSPRGLIRRSSSVVNRVETDRETIFFNSPDAKNADIVHEIVPEIKVAKQVFERPGTVEKYRQVSQQIRSADEALITRRRSLMPLSIDSIDKKSVEVIDSPVSVPMDVSTQLRGESQNASTKAATGIDEPRPIEAQRIPEMDTQSVEPAPKDDTFAKPESSLKATDSNISTVDTATSILSRNVMYKYEEVQDSSSDSSSSSSESDTLAGEGTLHNNDNAKIGKWRWSDVFYCCWSRR